MNFLSPFALLLWQAALRDREASTFFQRLQRDPLLILQILALLALTVALARPAVTVMGQGAKRVAIVMDTSASMKATDVSPSRFGQAQRAALGLLGRLGEGAEVMVIEAGVQPKVVVPFTREHDRVASALRSMEGHDLPNRLAEGLRTARALVGADPRAEIHVFTDGAHPEAAKAQGDDVRVRWTGVGRRSHNVGITSLAVRRNYFGSYNSQAFFSVGNFSGERQSFSLRLTLDDETLTERTLTLDPQVRRAIVVPFSEQRGGVLKLKLDVSDDLDADNVAYAVIPAPRTLSVLLVSPGNLFLEKVLHTDPQVKLEVRKPDAYQGGMEGFDVVVVDSVSPPKLGNGRFVLVNTVPGDVPLEVLGRLDNPTIMDWDRTHPIMRQIDFAKVTIEDALRVRPLAAGKTLVEAVGGPLIYALEERDRKALFFGFDLFRTDFPLRVAFPLILSKGLRWLSPVGLDQSSLQLQAGQPILLPVEHGVTTATVRTPSGRSVRAQVNRGMASFTDTDEVGVYAVVTGRGETKVAVNLMNADESDLTPQPVPTFVEGVRPESPPVLIQRELWPFFVMLALLLFALEGFLYWRRQTGGRLGLPRGLGDRWALGLRCALLAVLLLSLTKPTIPRWADRLNVTFLLDVSDSVSLAARESGYRFAAQSVASMQPGDQAGVVVFGEEAMVDQPLRATAKLERPQAQVGGRGTNLAQALQLGLATAPPGQANRFVLLTDGRQNAGNALAVAQAAKDAGADIYYVPAPLTFPQEVVVESMVLPQEVKFGEPFQAKVVAWSQAETQGRLSLYRNAEFLGSQVVRLSPGKNVFTYRQSLEQSGIHVYQAALDVDGDTIEENNRAVGTLVVRGRPQVLLAEKDRNQAQALAAALRSQHVDVTVVEAGKIPKDMAGLQKYDGLILSNVSSLKMTKKQMENIRDYVREQGGGLVMLGGEESFGLGGYYRTPIEEALPVTMEVKQKIEIPSLAVVLSIDRSGSMAMTTDEKVTKLDIAKEAAHLVVDLLDERNEVGVMSWDTEFIWDAPLKPAGAAEARHLLVGRADDPRRLLGPAAADGQGQDHGLHRGHRQGRRRAPHGGRGQVGPRAVLLHRGRRHDPPHLHPGDPARLQGLAGGAALQGHRGQPGPRGHPGDQLEGGAAARRLRGHQHEEQRGPGADDAPGGSAARHVALRPGPVGGLHLRRQGQVGRALGALGRLQQVLVPGDALDVAYGHPERYGGHGLAHRQRGRDPGRRHRPQGRVHQLPGLTGRRGVTGQDAHRGRSRADRPGPLPRALPGGPGGGVSGGHGPAPGGPDGRLPARGPGGALRAGVPRPGGRRDVPPGDHRAHRGRHAERSEGRVPPEPAQVAPERGHLAVAGGAGGGAADSGGRAAPDGAGRPRSADGAPARGSSQRRAWR